MCLTQALLSAHLAALEPTMDQLVFIYYYHSFTLAFVVIFICFCYYYSFALVSIVISSCIFVGKCRIKFARPTRGNGGNMQQREIERWMGIPKALPVFNGRRFLLCCLCRLSSWIIFQFQWYVSLYVQQVASTIRRQDTWSELFKVPVITLLSFPLCRCLVLLTLQHWNLLWLYRCTRAFV